MQPEQHKPRCLDTNMADVEYNPIQTQPRSLDIAPYTFNMCEVRGAVIAQADRQNACFDYP